MFVPMRGEYSWKPLHTAGFSDWLFVFHKNNIGIKYII